MTDPQFWWFLSRVSAMIAWGLMSVSIVWGVLLASRVFRGLDNPAWLKDLHKYLSTLTIALTGVHVGSLMLDEYVHFSIIDVLVPGAATFSGATALDEIALTVGVIAFWLLATVYVTSLFLDKLPRKLWKGIHFFSYVIFLITAAHAAFLGTDVGSWWYAAVSIFVITMSLVAVILRLVTVALVARKREKDAELARLASTSSAIAVTNGAAPVVVNAAPDSREPRSMVVAGVSYPTADVVRIRLTPINGGSAPWWDAGSHITLHLPNGLERQYSLCGDPTDRGSYEIAVRLSPTSAGGSRWIHDNVRAGSLVTVSGPRNHFPLIPAARYLFIAGGIGITPIKAMIESVPERREWSLVYVGNSVESMPFVSELVAEFGGRVTVHESSVQGRLNVPELLSTEPGDVYCCGPESLMSEVEEVVGLDRAHIERFTPVLREQEGGTRPVRVTCVRSNTVVDIPADESVIDGLARAGVEIEASCKKGVCGTCETRIVSGTAAHLDSVLPDNTKDEMHVFYPCVSRSTTAEMVIDA
ncbi:MAG: 2Fe-2S iron-sulfur cluster-binding protein [Microbacteriaceae bacterium]